MNILAKLQAQVAQQRELFEAAIVCLECEAVFEEIAEEHSCEKCGERYDSQKEDSCPECGSPHVITHCPGCDETDPMYLLDVLDNLNDYVEDEEKQQEVLSTIESFLQKRTSAS